MSERQAESAETLAQVYVLLRRHEVWGYNGSEIACRCDHKWRSLHDHADHHAETLVAAGVILPPVTPPTSTPEEA